MLLALYGDGHSVNSPTMMNAMFSIIKGIFVHDGACDEFPFSAILPVASLLSCLMIKHFFTKQQLLIATMTEASMKDCPSPLNLESGTDAKAFQGSIK
jgi:hypothetical protein